MNKIEQGEIIKKLFTKSGWTIKKLSQQSGVSLSRISHLFYLNRFTDKTYETLLQALEQNTNAISSDKFDCLTKTEKTVAFLMLKGKSNQELADELFVTKSAIKWHVNSIFKKLNVKTRFQFIVQFTDKKEEMK